MVDIALSFEKAFLNLSEVGELCPSLPGEWVAVGSG